MVTDNVGDPAVIISLTANSATSGNFGLASLPTTNGATKIMITPVGTGPWDFFIDNITFDYNKGEEVIPTFLVSDSSDKVYGLATTLTTLAIVMLQTDIDPDTALYCFAAQAVLLDLIQLATDADVEAAAAPAAAAAGARVSASAALDPNYKQPYFPTFVQLPTIQSDAALSAQGARDANTALKDSSLAIGYMQALVETINRLNSAIQQNDPASTNLQSAQLDTFLGLSSASLAAVAKDFNALANDFTGVSLPTLTASQISSFINNVKTNGLSGLPQQEQTLFNTIGVSAADAQSIVSAISSINPSTVPTSLVSSLQQLGTSLQNIADVYNGTAAPTITAQTIQNDFLGITRTALDTADATTEANAINAGTPDREPIRQRSARRRWRTQPSQRWPSKRRCMARPALQRRLPRSPLISCRHSWRMRHISVLTSLFTDARCLV